MKQSNVVATFKAVDESLDFELVLSSTFIHVGSYF